MTFRKRTSLAFVLSSAMVSACGGRETGTGGEAGAAPNLSGAASKSVPGCGAICGHIVGACEPGASSGPCVSDCELAKKEFEICAGDLDAYFICVGGTSVECRANEIVILDCSAERMRLESCRP